MTKRDSLWSILSFRSSLSMAIRSGINMWCNLSLITSVIVPCWLVFHDLLPRFVLIFMSWVIFIKTWQSFLIASQYDIHFLQSPWTQHIMFAFRETSRVPHVLRLRFSLKIDKKCIWKKLIKPLRGAAICCRISVFLKLERTLRFRFYESQVWFMFRMDFVLTPPTEIFCFGF